MPKLITKKNKSQEEPCNFNELSLNEFTEEQVSLEQLKLRCTRYLAYLDALQPPQGDLMVRAASFTTDSVLSVIQDNPTAAFIRVYYGIEENGRHLFFMAPVSQDGTTETGVASIDATTVEETTFADSCCECPPVRNCPEDPLLEENA